MDIVQLTFDTMAQWGAFGEGVAQALIGNTLQFLGDVTTWNHQVFAATANFFGATV